MPSPAHRSHRLHRPRTDTSPPALEGQDKLAYSIDEAAHALGLGKTTVKALIADGSITSVRVGRRRIIPRCAPSAFLSHLITHQVAKP